MKLALVALLAVGLASQVAPQGSVLAAPSWRDPVQSAQEDEIKSLPGLDGDTALGFRHFSGYVPSYVGGDFGPNPRFTHYWLVESTRKANGSAHQPPLVVWLNGRGPGESALLGMFLENGPFELAARENTTRLKLREHGWHREASLLYLDTPESVGFSYTQGRPDWFSDAHSMYQQMMSLKYFLAKFPKYKDSRLFLAGQGYGGALTALMAASYPGIFDNLRGIIIGNGWVHPDLLDTASLVFAHEKGLLDAATWGQVSQKCCNGAQPGPDTCKSVASGPCAALIEDILAGLRKAGVDPFNVRPGAPARERQFGPLTSYLNQARVREALHIPLAVGSWTPVRDLADYWEDRVNETGEGLLPQFRQFEWMLHNGAPVLMYNGDSDMVCSALGAKWFAEKLGRRVKSDWAPWQVNNRTAGYAKEYERGLTIATVTGAGHEVPSDKPQEALALVSRFINKYDKW